jgi:glutathione synthase/RimK-type ligase-like ATP-grasp enzyme
MKEIKQYLVKRLEKLNYELGYFEDDDEGCNLASAKAVNEEITEVNNLLILFDVVASLPTKKEINFDGNILAEIETNDKNLKVLRAVNGWGYAIDKTKIYINEK